MTTHEPCDALFSTACCGKCDSCELREVALKRAGAVEALENLAHEISLRIIAVHNSGMESLLDGLFEAMGAIEKTLAGYNAPVEAGGTFPPGYFDDSRVAACAAIT